jgi:hypothetical protein
VLEAPIAFVKRPIPVDEDGDERQPDVRDPTFFMAGGDVYIRSNSTITASEINITAAVTGGQGDVKDLMPSFDGNKLLFSLRLFDENENDDEVPSWNIYEYDLGTRILRRVIGSDFTAEEGDDLAPAYLPDGRIVFSSNRQVDARKMLLDEGKPPFKAMTERGRIQAFTLHVMDEDGQNIQQLSFNQSHDLYPTVLSSLWPGEILYTRWDHAGGNDLALADTRRLIGEQQKAINDLIIEQLRQLRRHTQQLRLSARYSVARLYDKLTEQQKPGGVE